MTYRTEFPDFDAATMPAIPADWTDTSWHNDTCPSFSVNGLRIFVDYADPAMREVPECERYSVHTDDDGRDICYGDDWAAVLRAVEEYTA